MHKNHPHQPRPVWKAPLLHCCTSRVSHSLWSPPGLARINHEQKQEDAVGRDPVQEAQRPAFLHAQVSLEIWIRYLLFHNNWVENFNLIFSVAILNVLLLWWQPLGKHWSSTCIYQDLHTQQGVVVQHTPFSSVSKGLLGSFTVLHCVCTCVRFSKGMVRGNSTGVGLLVEGILQ